MNPVGYFEFEMDKDARNAPYVHKPEELKLILASIRSLGVDALLDWLKDLVRFHPEPDHPPLFLSGINSFERSGGQGTDAGGHLRSIAQRSAWKHVYASSSHRAH